MRLFGSKAPKPGWFCINLMPDRVDVCHVLAAGRERPEIALCDSYKKEGGDVATLARLRRELHLDRHRCTTLLRPGDYQVMYSFPRPTARAGVLPRCWRWRPATRSSRRA
jgi:hypothetical protein